MDKVASISVSGVHAQGLTLAQRGAPGYAVGYVGQQAAALCSQVRDLDAIFDSDPSLKMSRTTARSTYPSGAA